MMTWQLCRQNKQISFLFIMIGILMILHFLIFSDFFIKIMLKYSSMIWTSLLALWQNNADSLKNLVLNPKSPIHCLVEGKSPTYKNSSFLGNPQNFHFSFKVFMGLNCFGKHAIQTSHIYHSIDGSMQISIVDLGQPIDGSISPK